MVGPLQPFPGDQVSLLPWNPLEEKLRGRRPPAPAHGARSSAGELPVRYLWLLRRGDVRGLVLRPQERSHLLGRVLQGDRIPGEE